MKAASYEKITINDPDFPVVVLENDKDTHGNRQELCPLHWHEHLELHYIREGTLHIWINQNEHVLQKGDLVLINENEIHSSYVTGRLSERILIFQLHDLSRNLADSVPAFQQIVRQDNRITDMMGTFEREYLGSALGFDVACKALLLQLVVYLSRSYIRDPASDPKYRKQSQQLLRLQPVTEYIELHYAEEIQVEMLAKMIYISKDRFNHLFKDCMGIPLRKYINDIRLHTAYGWLEQGLCAPGEAASRVGFTDYNHFGRLFRQTFGCTPVQAISKTAK